MSRKLYGRNSISKYYSSDYKKMYSVYPISSIPPTFCKTHRNFLPHPLPGPSPPPSSNLVTTSPSLHSPIYPLSPIPKIPSLKSLYFLSNSSTLWGNGELGWARDKGNRWNGVQRGQGGCRLYGVALRNSLVQGNPINICKLQMIFRISV